MEDYYKVLQYLRETHIDRQYPFEFEDIDYVLQQDICSLSDEYNGDFENSLKIENISDGDMVTIQLPKIRDFNDVDTFEIIFYTQDEVSTDDITIGFSNLRNGSLNQLELTKVDISESDSFINDDGYHQFKYLIRKTNTKMQKKTRRLSNVASINLEFNTDVSEIYIVDMLLRVDQFTITLEDLDEQIVMGRNYVLAQLLPQFSEIPTELEFLCFKASGAYSWLIWWENEGKVMDDGTKKGRNYATRLLDEIDRFIENWKEAQEEEDLSDKVNLDILGFGKFCNVRATCKDNCNRNRKTYYKGSLVR